MIRKTYDGVYFKALNDETGEFEAVVSVFGNVDLQGDRTMPGAFSKSLDNWRASGDPIPVIWSHDWGDPFAHIGYVSPEDAYEIVNEDAKAAGTGIMGGLFVKGHLDVDKPFAKQVYDLLKERRVREWSFAYDVVDEERNAKDHANELNEVALFEVGPTLKGANSATTTLGVKSILDTAAAEDRAFTRFKRWLDVDSEVAHKLLKDLNEETLLSAKEMQEQLAEFKWDGPAAMQSCNSAADFRKIAFEKKNDSDPDTQAHWGLPHHPSPGAGADEGGVSAALGALNGSRGADLAGEFVASMDSIRAHLEAHQGGEKHDADGVFTTVVADSGTFEQWSEEEKASMGVNHMALRMHLEADHAVGMARTEDMNQGDLNQMHRDLHAEGKSNHEYAEKAEFKPWHVEKRGDQFCCIKDSDNSTVDCHDTREAAMAHIRALYAAEETASAPKWVDVSEYVKEIRPGQEAGSVEILLENPSKLFTNTNTSSTTTNVPVTLTPTSDDKAGRAISKETEERLRRMREDIDAILSSVTPADEEKSVEAPAPTAEEVEAEKAKAELEELKRKLDLLDL